MQSINGATSGTSMKTEHFQVNVASKEAVSSGQKI